MSVLKPSVQTWAPWLPASQHLGVWRGMLGGWEGVWKVCEARSTANKCHRRAPEALWTQHYRANTKTSVPTNVLRNFLTEKSWFHTIIWKPLQSKTELPVFNADLPKLQTHFLASDSTAAHLMFQPFPPVVGLTRENRPSPQTHGCMKWGFECKMHIRFWRPGIKKACKISHWYFHIDHMLKG